MENEKNQGNVSNLYEKKIRVASSVPSLNNKIQTKMDGFTDKIYWYIKFNLTLDRKTVSTKTMNVTDMRGYILKSDISYDMEKKCIALYPEDTYESDQFYLLNISKKVCSESGQSLKHEIHILFKLVGNRVSEFKILKNDAKIPKPKARPKDYEEKFMNPNKIVRNAPISKLYSFDKHEVEREGAPDKLLTLPVKINIILGVIGVLLAAVSIFMTYVPLLTASIVTGALGIAHIIYQIIKKDWRAVYNYNKGVRLFNKERYNGAEVYFKKAQILDPYNERVEYALNKLKFYM